MRERLENIAKLEAEVARITKERARVAGEVHKLREAVMPLMRLWDDVARNWPFDMTEYYEKLKEALGDD